MTLTLSDAQQATLDAYADELARLNRAFNLVSPRTVREIPRLHVGHSLALAARPIPAGATVVDWGSGGGLPAVPLAVAFPDAAFVAVDSVGKKTEAVRLFARRLGLDNLSAWNGRADAYDGPAPHLSVSRATAPLADLWAWHAAVAAPLDDPAAPPTTDEPLAADRPWAPGLVCLKGGDLTDEIAALHAAHAGLRVVSWPVRGYGRRQAGRLGRPRLAQRIRTRTVTATVSLDAAEAARGGREPRPPTVYRTPTPPAPDDTAAPAAKPRCVCPLFTSLRHGGHPVSPRRTSSAGPPSRLSVTPRRHTSATASRGSSR